MYLMAIYGNGNWVSGYFNEQIFLNDKLAKEKNIPIEELRAKSGEFLRRMSGVNEAYTFDEILNNPVGENLESLHRSVYNETAGDIYLEIAPGWTVVDDLHSQNPQSKQIRNNAVNTPIFILSPNVEPQKIPVKFKLIRGTDNRIQAVDVEISEVSLVIEYRKRFYQMIQENDGEINWFLGELEDMVKANERSAAARAEMQAAKTL